MKRVLAVLCLLCAPASAAMRVQLPAAIGPLPAVGGAVQAAVPGLAPGALRTPIMGEAGMRLAEPSLSRGLLTLDDEPLASALDPRKPAVLLERARGRDAAGVAASAEAFAPHAAKDPVEAFERINAVLGEIPLEELERMPEETLHALSAVILDGMAPGRKAKRKDQLAGIEFLSRRKFDAIMAGRGKPVDRFQPYKAAKDLQTVPVYITGTPDHVRSIRTGLEPDDGVVYRHYTGENVLDRIVKEKRLWNAVLPYIELIHYISRTYYDDLTGLFLTKPGVEGRRVGVAPEHASWVDVRIPRSIPILQPDRRHDIWLVPMAKRRSGWMRDYYRGWVRGESLDDYALQNAKKMDGAGGAGPVLSLPVEIVGSSAD